MPRFSRKFPCSTRLEQGFFWGLEGIGKLHAGFLRSASVHPPEFHPSADLQLPSAAFFHRCKRLIFSISTKQDSFFLKKSTFSFRKSLQSGPESCKIPSHPSGSTTCEVSSVVEHILHTDGVISSNLILRTSKSLAEMQGFFVSCLYRRANAAKINTGATQTRP